MATTRGRDALLREYDELEDRIEDAATTEVWTLADWLAANVPNEGGGRPSETGTRVPVSLADLAERRGRGIRWLRMMRKVAEATRPDRLPGVPVRNYHQALQRSGWNLAEANARLRSNGSKLRDQSANMMSVAALKDELAKQPVAIRAEVARDILREFPPPEDEDAADRRRDRHDRRERSAWADIDVAFIKVKRHLREVILLVREFDLDDEAIGFMARDLADVRHAIETLELAVQTGLTVDWDAELAKLEEEER